MKRWLFTVMCVLSAAWVQANPIPWPPPARMPLEDMRVWIQPAGDGLHARFRGDFTFTYIPEEVRSMLFPVPPDALNISVRRDGMVLPWTWSNELYPTVLPELPTIPMIRWPGPFPRDGAVFTISYEHHLITRPAEFIFFYALGTGKYFPTYEKTTTAHFDIVIPEGFTIGGVWLDETPHEYELTPRGLRLTVESQFGPITKDLIVSLIPSIFTDCGTLVHGVECMLFQADGGGLYILDNLGGFGVGDRVRVSGVLEPACPSYSMENDGCIRHNTISLCRELPWWWPPRGVRIVPENPTSSDVIEITLSGQWPDTCIPGSLPIVVTGNDLYFTVISDDSHGCGDAVTPWSVTQSVGPLAAGTYRLYTSLDRGPWTLMTEFAVRRPPETNIYVFAADQSKVVQTGGFAGIYKTYSVKGWFQLSVDFDANTASFDRVDANLIPSDASFLYTPSLGRLFNMTGLAGTVVSDNSIEFHGKTTDGTEADVFIGLTLREDCARLTGEIVPGCCDQFNYGLDAVAFLVPKQAKIHVATDGNDVTGDGSVEKPFRTIQKGINVARDGDMVIVRPGIYLDPDPLSDDNVNFLGKNITLRSMNPTNPDIVNSTIIRGRMTIPSVQFRGTEGPDCTLAGFKINGAIYGADRSFDATARKHTHATISHCIIQGCRLPCGTAISDCDGTISNCLIADTGTNGSCLLASIAGCHGVIKSCTIANNEDGVGVLVGGTTTIENCIMYYNGSLYAQDGPQVFINSGGVLNISYSDIQGGLEGIYCRGTVNWGPGNIDLDPCFAKVGYHDPKDPWEIIEGDYHLRSEAGRWDPNINSWVIDGTTSPCIDTGNPGCPLGEQAKDPNSVRLNMGAHGGTVQASRSPFGWGLLADLNNDHTVDENDLGVFAKYWLDAGRCIPADLDRDGSVNLVDFARFASRWLHNNYILLQVYSDGWGTLLDTLNMDREGEITISVEEEYPYFDPPRYYIYASRPGYYTELYYCEKGQIISVDLDPIDVGRFNGVIFMNDDFFADFYCADTDVQVIKNDAVITEFHTDEQGRFTLEIEPGTYYFKFQVWYEYYFEQVQIQGRYRDFSFPFCSMVDKPNIYLYPEETIDLHVDILFQHGGRITKSVPDYGDGWHVTVEPNGIIDRQYDALFYECVQPDYGQYSAGWVVARTDLETFFRNNMALTGFNEKETNDFIEYWVPRLDAYPYYALYPQYNAQLDNMMRLQFSVQPANILRLTYSVRGLQHNNLKVEQPAIPAFSRDGFTVAEWGVIRK